MKILGANLFPRKLFWTIKIFRPKNFWWKFWVLTCFRGNDFATIKISTKIFLMKILVQSCFQGNDIEARNISNKIFFKNIFGANHFSRKWFLGKKFNNLFCWKYSVQTTFRGNDFATIKKFRKNYLMKIIGANEYSRKWFYNNKKIWTKIFLMKILVQSCFWVNDYEAKNNFDQNCFDENFRCKPVFKEIILQQ